MTWVIFCKNGNTFYFFGGIFFKVVGIFPLSRRNSSILVLHKLLSVILTLREEKTKPKALCSWWASFCSSNRFEAATKCGLVLFFSSTRAHPPSPACMYTCAYIPTRTRPPGACTLTQTLHVHRQARTLAHTCVNARTHTSHIHTLVPPPRRTHLWVFVLFLILQGQFDFTLILYGFSEEISPSPESWRCEHSPPALDVVIHIPHRDLCFLYYIIIIIM